MESRSYVLSFRMVFFYFVTTGWMFDINFFYVRRIQSKSIKNQSIKLHRDVIELLYNNGHHSICSLYGVRHYILAKIGYFLFYFANFYPSL